MTMITSFVIVSGFVVQRLCFIVVKGDFCHQEISRL